MFMIGFNLNLQLYTSRLCCWYLLEVIHYNFHNIQSVVNSKTSLFGVFTIDFVGAFRWKKTIRTKFNRMCVIGKNVLHTTHDIMFLSWKCSCHLSKLTSSLQQSHCQTIMTEVKMTAELIVDLMRNLNRPSFMALGRMYYCNNNMDYKPSVFSIKEQHVFALMQHDGE